METLINNYKDVIYLFDLELHKPLQFASKADNRYKLHLMLNHMFDRNDYNKIIGYNIEVILTGPDGLFESDTFSQGMDNKYVFDFIKWFHENPQQMHKTLYHDFFVKIVKPHWQSQPLDSDPGF